MNLLTCRQQVEGGGGGMRGAMGVMCVGGRGGCRGLTHTVTQLTFRRPGDVGGGGQCESV